MEMIYKLIICHFAGDYVLQCDFIAKTKGDKFVASDSALFPVLIAILYCVWLGMATWSNHCDAHYH